MFDGSELVEVQLGYGKSSANYKTYFPVRAQCESEAKNDRFVVAVNFHEI